MDCGKPNDYEANFCVKCGTPFNPSKVSRVTNAKKIKPEVVIEASEIKEEEEGEGISLQHCPEITGIEVDMVPGTVEKIPLSALIPQPKEEKK